MPTFHQRCKRRQHRHNQAIPQKKNKRETKIMVSRRSFLAASAAGGVMAASSNTLGQVGMTGSVKTGYAPVNGLKLYYELHVTGQPLIFLHGEWVPLEMSRRLVPESSRTARSHECW